MDTQTLVRERNSHELLRGLAMVVGALTAFAAADVACAMQRIQLTPTGLGGADDKMGYAVAILGDTAVVGAPGTVIAQFLNPGVVDVYRLANGVWHQESTLVPRDASPDMWFGSTLALGQDLLVVGASTGPTYTFERDGSTWTQVDEFDAAGPVALSGDTLVAANVVYARAGDGWQVQAQFTGDDPLEFMGTSVAIDGDLMVMTSVTRSFGADDEFMYLFSRTGSTWTREGRFELPIGLFASGAGIVALSGQTVLAANGPGATSVRVFDRHDDGTWTDDGILDAGTDLAVQSLSLDGDLALIGNGDGTAYTFARSGGVWTRELHFNDPSYSGCFVSVALEDTTALAGCPGAVTASGGYGKADVFSLDSDPPTIAGQLDQGNSLAGSAFGTAVSLSGDTVLVLESKGADIFDGSGGSWVPQAQIRPNPNQMWAVALDGDTAAVGYVGMSGVGAVDILTRTGGTWTLQTTLSGSVSDNYGYGFSLALEADTLVVCNPFDPSNLGACHIVERSGSTWSETATLHSETAGERFGWAVSLSGDTVLVGAPFTTMGLETEAGAVYAFVRSQGIWTQQAEMFAPLPAVNAEFGRALDFKGDTAVISAGDPNGDRGAVYVYQRAGEVWAPQATLTPPMLEPPLLGAYGASVAISDAEDTVVVGDTIPGLADDVYAGVAFVFKSSGAEWSYASMLQSSPPYPRTTYDSFGYSVSLSGETVAIGAPFDGLSGAVYVGSIAETIFADGFDPSP